MNKYIKLLKTEILSNNWYILKKLTFEQKNKRTGEWEMVTREAYDRGNGAALLLYNKKKQTIILTRQFRMPTFINGNEDGMMLEVCAGLLDDHNPEECIRIESEEETGYQVHDVKKVMQAYMSPGSVTEILHFFIAEYEDHMKISDGGGLATDHEQIDVVEMTWEEAKASLVSGEINDAKTIILIQYAIIHKLMD